MTFRTVHDPFTGSDVKISDRLVDRLRGKYASGPHLPNGNPEFGWRQFQAPPIQHEAAARIEAMEAAFEALRDIEEDIREQASGEQDGYLLSIANQLRKVIEMAN